MTDFDAQAWANTPIDNSGTSDGPPEPGNYEAEITDGSYFISKAGKPIVKLTLKITSPGPVLDHEWDEIRSMHTEGGMKAAKATVSRLGIDVDTITSGEELDQALKACIGHFHEVRVVQNGEYRNTYINDRVTTMQDTLAAMPAAQPASAVDDTVPF